MSSVKTFNLAVMACSFSTSLCQWTGSDGNFAWIRNEMSTKTERTGPTKSLTGANGKIPMHIQ